MDAALDVIVGLLVVAFGGWRVMAGLCRLDVIAMHVPGYDFFFRFLPRWMRLPNGVEGSFDAIGGLIFLAAGASLISKA